MNNHENLCQSPHYPYELVREHIGDFLDQAERRRKIEEIVADMPIDRLRELVDADREGRCVVFKFSLGSTIYRAWKHPLGYNSFVSEHKITTLEALANSERWRNAYPTREAAEAALKRSTD